MGISILTIIIEIIITIVEIIIIMVDSEEIGNNSIWVKFIGENNG